MRVIAGKWRGQKLFEPKNREVTRPTTDRVREAASSIIEAAREGGIEGARVLDAFAGSGAMGIEMLSRGARYASFYDQNRGAALLVEKNLAHLHCPCACCSVHVRDVCAAASGAGVEGGPFDLVLLDPPYAFDTQLLSSLLDGLIRTSALARDALVLYEHARAADTFLFPQCSLLRVKHYGSTSLTLFQLLS